MLSCGAITNTLATYLDDGLHDYLDFAGLHQTLRLHAEAG